LALHKNPTWLVQRRDWAIPYISTSSGLLIDQITSYGNQYKTQAIQLYHRYNSITSRSLFYILFIRLWLFTNTGVLQYFSTANTA
jgi:hypothetical protein